MYTQGQLKLTHRNFTILNSHVTVIYLAERFMKNSYFYVTKQKKRKKKKKKLKINIYLLKNLEMFWLLRKNLKESYNNISAGNFIKNSNMVYDFRVEIYL